MRRVFWSMTSRPRLVLLLLAGLLRTVQAQVAVSAPGGTLRGTVQDSTTGLPVSYALVRVVGGDQRVFASEAGRFTLTGLSAGTRALRIQQIGYRAVTMSVRVDTRAEPAPRTHELVVTLAPQPFALPAIVVQGDRCAGAQTGEGETGTILDEAFRNAERLYALQQAYPFQVTYERVTTLLDSTYSTTGGRVDTVRYDSREVGSYRPGSVLEPAVSWREETAKHFTVSEIAREEFRSSHCFWYAGRDSVQGSPAYRIDFAPTPAIKSVDWAGTLLLDSTSMRLLRSEAHLVNLPARGTKLRSANCSLLYKPITPTLVDAFQARCAIARVDPPGIVVERWLLIDHAFLGKRPDPPEPPG
jgi:hypothetical protein